MTGIHMIVTYIARIIYFTRHVKESPLSPVDAILMGIAMVFVIPTLLGVACLFIYQIQLVMDNTTCIESFEKEEQQRVAKRKGKPYRYLYDRGCCENLRDVFGPKLSLWFLPTIPSSDGMTFKTAKGADCE